MIDETIDLETIYVTGRKLVENITIHDDYTRGLPVIIYGDQKERLTLMTTFCQMIACKKDDAYINETIVWRGQDVDHWMIFPKDRTRIFVYKDDLVSFNSTDESIKYNNNDLPQIIKYKSNSDLYLKLLQGGINVIYEPIHYILSNNIKNIISKRCNDINILKEMNELDDSKMWWIDFIYWLRTKYQPITDDIKYISIFINNFDQLISNNPSGVYWHLHLFFKDIFKELRMRRISLFVSCNTYKDIDQRFKPSIICKIYTKGSIVPICSVVNPRYNKTVNESDYYINLENNKFIIELRDEYGQVMVNPIDLTHKIIALRSKPTDEVFGSKGCGKTIKTARIIEKMKKEKRVVKDK